MNSGSNNVRNPPIRFSIKRRSNMNETSNVPAKKPVFLIPTPGEQDEIIELREQNAKLNAENERLKQQNPIASILDYDPGVVSPYEGNQRVIELEEQVQILKQQLNISANGELFWRKGIEALTGKLETVKRKSESSDRELSLMQKAHTNLIMELDKKEAELKRKEFGSSRVGGELNAHNAAPKSMKPSKVGKKSKKKLKRANKEQEKKKLVADNTALVTEAKQTKAQLDDLASEKSELVDSIKVCHLKIQDLESEVSSIKQECLTAKIESSSLQSDHSKLVDKYASLQNSLSVLLDENKELNAEKGELESKYEGKIAELASKCSTYENENSTLIAQNCEMFTKIGALIQQTESLVDEKTQLEITVEKLEKQKLEFEKELRRNREMFSDLDTMKEQSDNLKSENSELQAKIDEQAAKLEAIEGANSELEKSHKIACDALDEERNKIEQLGAKDQMRLSIIYELESRTAKLDVSLKKTQDEKAVLAEIIRNVRNAVSQAQLPQEINSKRPVKKE